MRRTADSIEENAENKSAKKPRKINPRSLANLVAPWTSETRPKSPGRPKDLAADISRKIFERNQEQIYIAGTKAILSGNSYAFDVHANRAFGKLKETKEINANLTHEYVDLPAIPDDKLREIKRLVESAAGSTE